MSFDARTFETEEIIRMPSSTGHGRASFCPISDPFAPHSIKIKVNIPIRVVPPPPRILLALEDTFRIPHTTTMLTIRARRTLGAGW